MIVTDDLRSDVCDYLRNHRGVLLSRFSTDMMVSVYLAKKIVRQMESEGIVFTMGIGANRRLYLVDATISFTVQSRWGSDDFIGYAGVVASVLSSQLVASSMTKGVLGLIVCPMVDDNLVYSLAKDPEEKNIVIVDNENTRSIKAKLGDAGVPYTLVPWEDIVSRRYEVDRDYYSILIYMISLGLHSVPDKLKSTVEELTEDMQPFVDGIGFYLGTCGNFNWNIPQWCEERRMKPSAMFCDKNGELCHDCVGVNIAGGPKYTEMQKKYTGHLYIFPAMATNYDEFMDADQADARKTEESLTDEMREALGIEPGRDGYMRWLFTLGGYEYILKLDTGLGNREEFERDLLKVSERTRLKIKVAEPGWADLQPTDDLYAKCKSFLSA